MILGSAAVLFIYAGFLIWALFGINKLPKIGVLDLDNKTEFSIIIAFRNEGKNLPKLLESLLHLKYPLAHFELLFIDDDSSDQGANFIHSKLNNSEVNYSVIQNLRQSPSPKKDAISLAITKAKHPWIITLDADCVVTPYWLSIINSAINSQNPDLIVGPVSLKSSKLTPLFIWQKMEHLGLQQLTKGSIGHRQALLANGANLTYKQQLFVELAGFNGNNHLASGDDQFLLEKAARANKKIIQLNHKEAAVTTSVQNTWLGAINQRLRWAAKSTASKNSLLKLTGLIIAFSNLWLLVLLIYILVKPGTWPLILSYLVGKMVIDLVFVGFKNDEKIKLSLFSAVCSNLSYPFVLIAIGLFGLKGSYQWKQRRFKK